ncbi:hypothetical protein D9M71_214510 [compost metagenome]
MHAEERHGRVGNRVDQVVDDLVVLFRQQVVLAAERADDELRLQAQHAHDAVGHQARAGDQVAAAEFVAGGAHQHFLGALVEADDFGAVADLATGGLELAAHGGGDFGVADDAAGRHEDAAHADDVRLALAQLAGAQPVALQAVGGGAFPERLHALHLQLAGGHQQLAALVVADAVPVAEGLGGLVAGQAELRLEAAGGVVDAGVDHAAVVPGLVARRAGFLLQQEDLRVRVDLGELHRGGHADDAAADDDEIVHSQLPRALAQLKKPHRSGPAGEGRARTFASRLAPVGRVTPGTYWPRWYSGFW